MRVLEISAHFPPNVGGVETHLSDLVKALIKRHWQVFVLTYQPLTTKAKWKIFESKKDLSVFRIPWIAGVFYKLVSYPTLEFLYLLPGLLIITPIIILVGSYDVIHAHGLVAGFVAVCWGKLFKKRVVVSTHSIYHFPKSGLYRNFVSLILNHADFVMGLSKQAAQEIKFLQIPDHKVGVFTYWVDLQKFKPESSSKRGLGLDKKFVVLFVGRLIKEKGVKELLAASRLWDKNIYLVVIGTGPLEEEVKKAGIENNSLRFLGKVIQDDLPTYYNAADLLLVPSVHEEGFGRVILEALSCGTPVVGAKRGAIPEAMDETVGKLIDVSVDNIKETVEYFYKDRTKLTYLAKNARQFAERRYSEKNAETIIRAYKQ